MKNLNKREKILISLLLIVGIGYVYYMLFLSPMLDSIAASKSSIEAYDRQLEEIQNILATNGQFKAEYDKAMEKFNIYSERMPDISRDAQIIYDFGDLTKKSATVVNNVNVAIPVSNDQGQAASENSIVTLPVSIDISGSSYVNVMKFVNLMENDTRIAQVKNVNITKDAAPNSAASVHANVNMEFYYLSSTSPQAINYNFNNGKYGKADLFK